MSRIVSSRPRAVRGRRIPIHAIGILTLLISGFAARQVDAEVPPGSAPRVESNAAADPVPVPPDLAAGVRSSPAVAAAARQANVIVDPLRLSSGRARTTGEVFVAAATNEPSAFVLYGRLPDGREAALVLRFLGGNRVRVTDADGKGLEATVVANGASLRIQDAQPYEAGPAHGRGGFPRGGPRMGPGDAGLQGFTCWAQCVVSTCETQEGCWPECGLSCGACLLTGNLCEPCVVCIGRLYVACFGVCR